MRDSNTRKTRSKIYDLVFILIGLVIYLYIDNLEDIRHEKEISSRNELIILQQSNIKTLKVIVNQNYNHVKRMQIISGFDTIKDVFSYKMKVLNPINQTQLLKKDFRVKKCRQ